MVPAIPSEEDREAALTSSRILAAHLQKRDGLRIRIPTANGHGEGMVLPPMAVRLLVDLLSQMARGNAVTLIPIHAELTTQQAADLLSVSRPFVVQLIKEKKLPARKVGTHRRVLFADLMRYKEMVDRDRTQALEELTKQARELDMGY
jgi:excisionase family DNA binding protein